MSSATSPPESLPTPSLLDRVLPNAATARMVRVVFRIFIAAGILGALNYGWVILSDLRARRTWPAVDGEVISQAQQDSHAEHGRIRKHTRYWVEYEVRFAVPADRCRTGTVSGTIDDPMPCLATIRTRSTQSPAVVYRWLNRGYRPNAPVTVLYQPDGPGVKIAGEPVWLRYPWDSIGLLSIWLPLFLVLHAIVQHRMRDLHEPPRAPIAS